MKKLKCAACKYKNIESYWIFLRWHPIIKLGSPFEAKILICPDCGTLRIDDKSIGKWGS